MPPGDLRIAQQRNGVAVLHCVQRVVERGIVGTLAAARRHACDIRRAAVDAGAVRIHLVLAAWTNVEGEIGKAAADPGTSLDPDIRPVIIPVERHARGRFQQITGGGAFIALRKAPEGAMALALCKLDRVVARACAQQTQISKPAVGAGERAALFHQKRQVQPCLDRLFQVFRARVPDGQRRAAFDGERTVRAQHIAVQIQREGLTEIRIGIGQGCIRQQLQGRTIVGNGRRPCVGKGAVGCFRTIRTRHRSNRIDLLTDRKLHGCRPVLFVVLGLVSLGVDVIRSGFADRSVLVDLWNGITVFKLQISSFDRGIEVCYRGIFLYAADRQQRQNLFAHRASCLGKSYGQIGIGLVDVAADRKRFFARLELVLYRGFAD